MIPQLVYKVSQILREDGQERHGAGIDQAAKHPPPPLDKKGGWEKKVRRRKRARRAAGQGAKWAHISGPWDAHHGQYPSQAPHTQSATAAAFDLLVLWNLCLCNKR